jgi:Protein-glutamine gamma-glutamyltransferase
VLSPRTLTANTDTLTVRFHHYAEDGTDKCQDYTFTESGPTTGKFIKTILSATCSELPKNSPGNFMPIVMRLPDWDCFEAADFRINTMGRDWKVKYIPYFAGNESHCFLVDDQDKPVIFNPSAYAHTHIQTKKIPLDPGWVFGMTGGVTINLPMVSGLLIKNINPSRTIANQQTTENAVKIFLGTGLSAGSYNSKTVNLGNSSYLNYDGTPTQVRRLTDSVRSEILWRYLATPDMIAIFNSSNEFKIDVVTREKTVQAATTAQFDFSAVPKMNPVYWRNNSLFLKATNASNAIADIWTPPDASQYRFACNGATLLCQLRGLAQAINATQFNAVINYDVSTNGRTLFPERSVAPSENGWNFIPGDRAYIKNKVLGADAVHIGENLIYLGGCFSMDGSTFETTAKFWGHWPIGYDPGIRIKTLSNWKTTVAKWGADGVGEETRTPDYTKIELLQSRNSLQQFTIDDNTKLQIPRNFQPSN